MDLPPAASEHLRSAVAVTIEDGGAIEEVERLSAPSETWYLRVSVKDSRTGTKRDTNKMLDGVAFATAVGRWESLRDDTRAAVDGQTGQ